MWLILRRSTGKQARIGREAAGEYARALTLLIRAVGEQDFELKYPELYHEMRCLIDKV